MTEPRLKMPDPDDQRQHTTQLLVDLAEDYEIHSVETAPKELLSPELGKRHEAPEMEAHVELRKPGVEYEPCDTPPTYICPSPLRLRIDCRHLRPDGASHALARWVYWWLVRKVGEAPTMNRRSRVKREANDWQFMFGVDAPRMEVV